MRARYQVFDARQALVPPHAHARVDDDATVDLSDHRVEVELR